MENKRKVKVNYFKFIRSLVILGIIIYFIIIGIQGLFTNLQPKEYEGEYTTYYVSKGETLWTISKSLNSNLDIREVVHLIREDNNISANLQIGQELKIREIYE